MRNLRKLDNHRFRRGLIVFACNTLAFLSSYQLWGLSAAILTVSALYILVLIGDGIYEAIEDLGG